MRHRSVRTRIGSILLTGAMLLSLLPMSALATEVTETTGTEIISEETAEAPANGPSDTGTVAGDEKDPDQGTEPTNEVGSGDAATVAAITTQETLKAAIDTAPDGGTVTLGGNIDVRATSGQHDSITTQTLDSAAQLFGISDVRANTMTPPVGLSKR